jgi:hypothetical protein
MRAPPNRRIQSQTGQRLRAKFLTGGPVARGQCHPIGIELETRDLARGQEPVVDFGGMVRASAGSARLAISPPTRPWVAAAVRPRLCETIC